MQSRTVLKLTGATVAAGVLLAGVMFPIAAGLGYASNRAADSVGNSSAELADGVVPAVTTMTDSPATRSPGCTTSADSRSRATRSPTT